MARPWRMQYEGAIYHVMSRGVGRGRVFLVNDDYFRFLEYVASTRERQIRSVYYIDYILLPKLKEFKMSNVERAPLTLSHID